MLSFLTHKIIKLINIKLLLLAATIKNWNRMSLVGASVSSWTVWTITLLVQNPLHQQGVTVGLKISSLYLKAIMVLLASAWRSVWPWRICPQGLCWPTAKLAMLVATVSQESFRSLRCFPSEPAFIYGKNMGPVVDMPVLCSWTNTDQAIPGARLWPQIPINDRLLTPYSWNLFLIVWSETDTISTLLEVLL